MAATVARTDVAVRMWLRIVVPREVDELPFPTDMDSLWIFYFRRECSVIRSNRLI